MPNRWPISSGNWSNTAIWSGSLIPTASDNVFANNFTVNIDTSFQVLTLSNAASASAVVAGGSFNFNSGSISGSVGSISNNSSLITVTHNTGSVSLNISSSISYIGDITNIFVHSGNGNFTLTVPSIFSQNLFNNGLSFFNKSSPGTLTINSNITHVGRNTSQLLNDTNNSVTIINGNVSNNGGVDNGNVTIRKTGGNLIINGNVTGGINASGNITLNLNGTITTILGNVIGGTMAAAINTTNTTFITGNITGSAAAGIITTAPVIVTGSVVAQGAAAAISSASTIFVNVSGSVISSATGNAISATAAASVVNLTGNMVNTAGKTAIYCQNLFLSNTATTTAQFFTVGSQDRTLYSSDTFPNLPSGSNVRFGTTYGPGSGNTGTLRMASPQDVRSGVLTDNTTGSAILSIESLSNEVQTSSDPFAQRLRDIATVDAVGYLLTAFKK